MSFFGKISDIDKVNISFDKIYPNRKTMDNSASVDNVYIGRCVLVSYNSEIPAAFREGFLTVEDESYVYNYGVTDTRFYKLFPESLEKDAHITEPVTRIPYKYGVDSPEDGYGVLPGDLVRVYCNARINNLTVQKSYFYFKCVDKTTLAPTELPLDYESEAWADGTAALFKPVDFATFGNYYSLNFNLDKNAYPNSIFTRDLPRGGTQGWDSTIWIKTLENGIVSYKLIGELNSRIPHFRHDIKAEPPSDNPTAPIFDARSTNLEYILRSPVSWGFRLGELEYNKAGFDINTRSKEEEITDDIKLVNAQSGNLYYDRKNNGVSLAEVPKVADDIKQLNLTLPSLGNAVCEIYDILYGDYNDRGQLKPKRNLDVDWDSKRGSRLIPDLTTGGYGYSPEQTATVAGCLNSIHDALGTIIVGEEVSLKEADEEHIYYRFDEELNQPRFYIKTSKNTYMPIENQDEYTGGKKYVSLDGYVRNTLYTKREESYYLEKRETPTTRGFYYTINLSGDNPNFKPINLIKWEQPEPVEPPAEGEPAPAPILNHYYRDIGGNYIKDNSEIPDPTRIYYTLTPELVTGEIEGANGQKIPQKVYKVSNPVQIASGEDTENRPIDIYSGYLMKFERDGEEIIEVVNQEDAFNPSAQYCYYENYGLRQGYKEDGTIARILCLPYKNSQSNEKYISNILITPNNFGTNGGVVGAQISRVIFVQIQSDKSYFELRDGNYYLTSAWNMDSEKDYYLVTTLQENGVKGSEGEVEDPNAPENLNRYYQPNLYHYLLDDNFLFAKEEEMLEDVVYYEKINEVEGRKYDFYVPKTYYYDILDNGVIKEVFGEEATMQSPTTNSAIQINDEGLWYYLPKGAYVYKDTANVLAKGSIWNKNAAIPDTVILGELYEGENEFRYFNEANEIVTKTVTDEDERESYLYEWKELEGFARNLNTIHGIIVHLNQLFKFDDELTRDVKTIQGCLNRIQDLVASFSDLRPGEFAVIDEYGRIKSAVMDTAAQEGGAEEGWINVGVNPDKDNTSITIRHNDAKTTNLLTKGQSSANTLEFGGSFKALQVAIDEKGHIPSSQLKDFNITLPSLKLTDQEASTKAVLTGLQIDSDNQGFSTSRSHAGDLILKIYDTPTPSLNATSTIKATDSISSAFSKLETALAAEITDRQTAITTAIEALDYIEPDANNSTKYISTISQTDGIISVTRADAGRLTIGNSYVKPTTLAIGEEAIKPTDNITAALGKLEKKIDDEVTNRENAFGGLDVPVNESTTQFISSISQTDGKIAVSRANAGTLVLGDYTLPTAAAALTASDSISSAFGKLEKKLDAEIESRNNVKLESTEDTSKFISNVSQASGGQIAITRATASTLTLGAAPTEASSAQDITSADTLGVAFGKVEKRLDLLENLQAEQNVQADWNETSSTSDAFIKNKPTNLVYTDDITGMVTPNTTFRKNEDAVLNITTDGFKISDILNYIAYLEERVAALETPETPTPPPTA